MKIQETINWQILITSIKKFLAEEPRIIEIFPQAITFLELDKILNSGGNNEKTD